MESIELNGQPLCEAVVLSTAFERLRGLLAHSRDAPPVRLLRCRSIHTFGMGYPIDVAFVASDGRVMVSERAVGAGRVISCSAASWVLERPACVGSRWPNVGDEVVALARAGACVCTCRTDDDEGRQ